MVLYFIRSYCTVSHCYIPLLERAGELPRSASSHFITGVGDCTRFLLHLISDFTDSGNLFHLISDATESSQVEQAQLGGGTTARVNWEAAAAEGFSSIRKY